MLVEGCSSFHGNSTTAPACSVLLAGLGCLVFCIVLALPKHVPSAGLTVVGHAHGQALLEAAVLALIAVLFLDLAATLTSVVLQLQTDGPPKETLQENGPKAETRNM